MRNGNKPKAALALIAKVVVAGDPFIGDYEIGLNQIPHRQVVHYKVFQKLDRFLLQLTASVKSEGGELLPVDFAHLELFKVQRLRRKLSCETGESRIGYHPRHFAVQLFWQPAAGG